MSLKNVGFLVAIAVVAARFRGSAEANQSD